MSYTISDDEYTQLKTSSKALDDFIATLVPDSATTGDTSALQQQVNDLTTTNQQLTASNQSLTSQVTELNAANQQLTTQLAAAKADADELRGDIKTLAAAQDARDAAMAEARKDAGA